MTNKFKPNPNPIIPLPNPPLIGAGRIGLEPRLNPTHCHSYPLLSLREAWTQEGELPCGPVAPCYWQAYENTCMRTFYQVKILRLINILFLHHTPLDFCYTVILTLNAMHLSHGCKQVWFKTKSRSIRIRFWLYDFEFQFKTCWMVLVTKKKYNWRFRNRFQL